MRNLLKEIENTIDNNGIVSIDEKTIAMELEALSDYIGIDKYSLEAIGENLYEIVDAENNVKLFVIQKL